jgi:hypothetical protein
MKRKPLLVAVIAMLSFGLVGCSKSEGTPVYPVTGKLVGADGKGIPHATVIFHPTNGDASSPKPRATTATDGTFSLTSHNTGDGAPAGNYRVTVELWLNSGKGDDAPTNRLPQKYAKPDESGFTATVNTSPTELQPFVIKR